MIGGIVLNYFNRVLSCILTVLLLVSALPPASAAGSEAVLTSIGHSTTTTCSSPSPDDSSHPAILYVPYSYSGTTLDLSNGLKIDYDESAYTSVVATVIGGPAAICSPGNPDSANAVQVKLQYRHKGDSDQAPSYQATYFVLVVRQASQPSVYSGEITRTLNPGNTLSLTAAILKEAYQQNDGPALDHFVIRGSNLVTGTLAYSKGDVFSTPVSLDSAGAIDGSLTFQASSGGVVSYYIDAYQKGSDQLLGTALLTLTVDDSPSVKSAYSGAAYLGTALQFSISDFTNLSNLWGGTAQSVEITPSDSACGVWTFNSTPLAVGSACQIDAQQIGKLTFTGSAMGTASFTWRITTASGTSGYGSGSIAVSTLSLSLSSYSSSSRLARGGTLALSASQFAYFPSSVALSYLKIVTIPTAADGYLCLSTALAKNTDAGYPEISANTALKAGAILPASYIPYLRLAATSNGTGASLSFTWTAAAGSSATSAVWAAAASYTVGFVSAGSVSYSASLNIPLPLDKSDFASAFSSQSGYSLSYVTFSQVSQTGGKLYYDYNPSSKTGTAASASLKYYVNSSPNLSQITFVPTADYIGTVEFAYKAYQTNGASLSGTLRITVSNSSGGVVGYTTDKNGVLNLDAADFSKAFSNATGETLSYLKLTPPSSKNGIFYYSYSSAASYDYQVSSSSKFYVRSSPYLSYLSFVPYSDYTGTVTVSFTGYSSAGNSYTGKLVIFVVDSPAGIVSYSCKTNGIVALQADDFTDEFIRVTGSVLSYVTFTPPASTVGVLYTQYDPATGKGTTVSGSAKYYNGSTPDLSGITFVPASGYTGTAEIKYTAYTAGGTAYVGKLKIAVGTALAGAVSYSTDFNTPFSLYAGDFASKFYSNTGGSSLSYVTFALPSTAYGTLYYNYVSSANPGTAVTGGKAYRVSGTPYLSNITFVPKTGYSGSFTLSYTGYTLSGTGYPGKITITVGNSGGSISYETDSLTKVTFRLSDFQDAFSTDVGTSLYSVKFSLPSPSAGTLYYGYTSASSYTGTVPSGQRYYAGSYPYLSNISFVPNPTFSGTLSIPYVAYDSSDRVSSGAVFLTVDSRDGGAVTYTADKNTAVRLDGDDFDNSFSDETGYGLSYVKFTLPSSAYGILYYYSSSTATSGTKLSASTGYYLNSTPSLSNVVFVPAEDFVGTVSIPYAAYTSGGRAYSGTLRITLLETDAPPFSDVDEGYSWASPAIAYLYKTGTIQGYQSGLFHPGSNLSRGDFILMVVRAFGLTSDGSGNFSDVAQGSYYYDAIATARAYGIALGSNGTFSPDAALSRQDAAVFLARALAAAGDTPDTADEGLLAGFSDGGSVSDYAAQSVAALVKSGVLQGNSNALHPKQQISRAEMAVILFRALTASN